MSKSRPSRRDALLGGFSTLLPATSAGARSADAAIRTMVVEQMRGAGIPGLAVGLAQAGRVVFAEGFGLADIATKRPVTTRTMFHIASITKTVTAAAILQLRDQGRLALDEAVQPHLDFPLANPAHPTAPITFRQLLMHVSSISDARYYEVDFRQRGGDATLPLGDMLKGYLVPGGATYSADKCFSSAAPGAAWDYSNIGYGLLGYLAGRIAGRDMRQVTERSIFRPLRMGHTAWSIAGTPPSLRATPYELVDGTLAATAPVGLPDWPVGGLRSSILDISTFAAALANGGVASGARILSPLVVSESLAIRQPPGLPDWLTGQGLGWMESSLQGRRVINHWGGDPGVFTVAWLDPAARRAVVVLANTDATQSARTAVKAISARLLGIA